MTEQNELKPTHMHEDRRRRPPQRYQVPVFPHVKKFLKKYSPPTHGVIKVDEYSILGKFVSLALLNPRNTDEHISQFRDRLTETITIEITTVQADRMSPRLNKLLRLNIDIDRLFKEHLVAWITSHRATGIPPYNACKLFLDHYSIDENEYSLKSAYQYWQRLKKRVDIEGKSAQS